MPRNSDGAEVHYGSPSEDYGGDTGLSPNVVYYCGRGMRQCRCGKCDGRCGPTKGCPCNSCVGLLGFKVNKDNVLCKKGAWLGKGGDTGMKAEDLYYCGRVKNECRCGECEEGTCGPRAGCPCHACLELVGLENIVHSLTTLTWLDPTDSLFRLEDAVQAGCEDQYRLYVARSKKDGEIIPGKYFEDGRAYFVHSDTGEIQRGECEVLVDPKGESKWVCSIDGRIPQNAILGGHSTCGDSLFIGRCKQNGHDTCGKILASKGVLEFGYFKKIFRVEDFEILVRPEELNYEEIWD